ncbi:MAG: ATP synthase subunit I [Sporocytophaga sp.]|nr:ATP synthase subunit I [Sporocytophaga sp.]
MNNLIFIICFLGGLFLGAIFYGGLWLTVKYCLPLKNPGIAFLGSFIFRISFSLIGFYYLFDKDWFNLLVCFAGFMLARITITKMVKSFDLKEFNHENKP